MNGNAVTFHDVAEVAREKIARALRRFPSGERMRVRLDVSLKVPLPPPRGREEDGS